MIRDRGEAGGLCNALIVSSGFLPLGALGFFLAARSLRSDIETVGSGADR